ncbi:MAG: Zn-ribbon domain-containing OB-fold protein [Desulfurococcales archaeon]|nr:Zn-ribbon domain-containing OB-fold protein [Desulfurococcales archaeon]MCE4621926.1 Zn-ribbon domain-containing OB-fold protein [Desulfurococcales archaeon]MCE4627280.1 Zn-ribbon domain-containing OB-fold protein [Desulfurococcales archaeon]MCE4629630.1 Zn-ribbon domain-containing OB-fold protein [Desulfurococcales archaeon]
MVLARWWRTRIPRYRLIGAQCKSCGRAHYPPRKACPYCGSTELEQVMLPRRGILESYTVVQSIPGDTRFQAPIIVGLVRLENGVRLVAELTDVQPEELKLGLEVEATMRRIREDGDNGTIMYGLKFRPILGKS